MSSATNAAVQPRYRQFDSYRLTSNRDGAEFSHNLVSALITSCELQRLPRNKGTGWNQKQIASILEAYGDKLVAEQASGVT
jgi:hypothetical protein